MTTITRLTEMRQSLWTDTKAILDGAEAQRRELTASEKRAFDTNMNDLDALRQRIDKVTKDDSEMRHAAETLTRMIGPGGASFGGSSAEDREVVDGLRSMLLENNAKPITLQDDSPRAQYQPGVERRDLLKTAPANFTPVSFYGQIVEAMVDASAVLSAGATVITTQTGETFRVPRATGMSTAALTAEADPIPESDPTLGVVELGAHKYGVLVQVSRELVDDSGADLQSYLARETGTALGLALGAHLINGTGTGQPRGVLADATAGVTGPSGTATSLGAQATAGQGTDLLNALYASVSEPYTRSRSAGYLLRSATMAAVRNLKGSTGELVGNAYLAAAPAPFHVDPFVPAMAANAKSILFGDWSRYFVRVVNGVRFERSDDFAFANDLVTYRAIIRADAALVDVSAIKYLANGAS